jgi:hypothetical protein
VRKPSAFLGDLSLLFELRPCSKREWRLLILGAMPYSSPVKFYVETYLLKHLKPRCFDA